MGAKYTSEKPEGYLYVRNNVYLDREAKQQVCAFEHANASRDLPNQSKANYGKKDISGIIAK